MSSFKEATRKKTKARVALCGVSGSGKTFTALRVAMALGKRIAVIDSEHGSAAKYTGEAPDGVPFRFQICVLESFSPSEYTAKIVEAGQAGFDVIVIDSLSHAWIGYDGALELVSKKGGNSYTAWRDVTPMHTRMIEAILRSPAHVIATMRSKTEYVLELDANGKQVPRKIGLAPIQRQGMEYEFDLTADIDLSHILTVTKTRCSALDGAIVTKPGASLAQPLLAWLNDGVDPGPALPKLQMFASSQEVAEIVQLLADAGADVDREKKDIFRRYAVEEFAYLTPPQAAEYISRLRARVAKKKPAAKEPVKEPVAKEPTTGNGATQPAAAAVTTPEPKAQAKPATPATTAAMVATPTKPAAATAATATTKPDTPSPAAMERLAAIRGQWAAVRGLDNEGLKVEWPALLSKSYGVTTAKQLTMDQLNHLLGFLQDEIALLTTEALQAHSATMPDGPGETLQEALARTSA